MCKVFNTISEIVSLTAQLAIMGDVQRKMVIADAAILPACLLYHLGISMSGLSRKPVASRARAKCFKLLLHCCILCGIGSIKENLVLDGLI